MLDAMQSASVSARLAAGGLQGMSGSSAFAERLERETAYWGPQLKKLGIHAE